MSFTAYKDTIEEGDTVILYLNPQKIYPIVVKTTTLNKNNEEIENVHQTMFGSLRVDTLIGKQYGTKVSLSRGWAFVLYPTPELWTMSLPHRTQVIYSPDISMIVFQLELKPGSIVIEAGTGSGSLTHALARTISPTGHVYSYDFHENRVLIAKNEFESHKISDVVSIDHRDVCKNGFDEKLENVADAVFLDLPSPWEVIPKAINCIKKTGGRFASFSPCIEQVQKTCATLKEHGFVDLSTIEVLQREFSVVTRMLPVPSLEAESSGTETQKFVASIPPQTMPGHTGYITSATFPPTWDKESECT